MITKTHYFYFLNYSPWPIISRISSFNLLFSLIIFFKFSFFLPFLFNIINIIISSFFWWINYRKEFNIEGKNSYSLERGLKFSIILFITSEIFFFFSFFWSYFYFFLRNCIEFNLIWPPISIEIFSFLNVPLINTLLLLRSGLTVTIRHFYLIENKKKLFTTYLILTVILGLFFSLLQLIEYKTSFFSIRDSTFGTTFFILTGFHGLHILIGTLFLIVCLFFSIKLYPSKINYARFEISSWYWHFVDVIWIFLYFFLYYLNN